MAAPVTAGLAMSKRVEKADNASIGEVGTTNFGRSMGSGLPKWRPW